MSIESHGSHSVLSRRSVKEKPVSGVSEGRRGSSGTELGLKAGVKSEVVALAVDAVKGTEGPGQCCTVQWGSCSFKMVV